jgi:hypothetical protein
MAMATIQEQGRQIAALRAQVEKLSARSCRAGAAPMPHR